MDDKMNRYSVDERGHVILTWGGITVDLGPEQDACTEMADFLTERDFGE
jgi:hypothetical protein